jgi:hypothetical protein
MPRVGFEPTTPVFERAMAFHILHPAATLFSQDDINIIKFRGCRGLKTHEKEENAYTILVGNLK